MAQQVIGVGAAPDDGTGDPARTAFTKTNDNFTELYARVPVTDGDKGDITVTASGITWTLDADAVTDTKLRNSAGFSVIGKGTTGSGDPADIIAGNETVLGRTAAGDLVFAALATGQIANDAVTFAKMQNVATDRLIGRDTAATGDPEEISLNATLEFTGAGAIQRAALTGDVTASAGSNTTTIANDVVTYAKIQNVSATSRFLGRITAAAGDVEELTGAQATTLVDTFTSALKGLAPSSGGGTTNFLRADGSWVAPAGGGSPGGQTTEVQFNNAGSSDGADRLTFASSTAGAAFGAGAATAGTWPTLASGPLLTTAEAGAIERDANTFYMTTDAGNRGYVPARHFIRANVARTLPNDLNLNAIFNDPANGRLTLETGTYLFEMVVGITAMSATSGNAQLNVLGAGTATVNDWLYSVVGKDGTLVSVGAVSGTMPVTSSTPASMFSAATGVEMWFTVRGTFTVTVAGTLIPSIDQVTAAAAIVAIGSYFSCERIGSVTVVSVGQWD